ncbi:MAG: ShlB/FhaC/HecB family hemolysin secretion/activation protein [Gammaproteobacteria bacterium]
MLSFGVVARSYTQEVDQQQDSQQTDDTQQIESTSEPATAASASHDGSTIRDASNISTEKNNESTSEEVTKFDIKEFRVRGNSLLDKTDVESVLYPFLGENKTIDDVKAASEALKQRYRFAGFPMVLVDIPEQDVDNRVVVLKVTEAYVDQIKITGSDYYAISRIREELPALKEGQSIYIPAVNNQIAAFNAASGDRSITPILRPGRIPGTIEVELKVKDKTPLHGSVFANNRHSDSTTSTRLGASARYDNLWQKEHSLSLQYQTAPEDPEEAKIWVATYLARLPESQSMLAVYGVKSDSDIAATSTVDVIGRGNILGLRFIRPFANIPGRSHSALAGVDFKDFKETTSISGIGIETPIRYYNFVAQYSGKWITDNNETNFTVSVNFGLQALNDRQQTCEFQAVDQNGNTIVQTGELNQFECKRSGSKPNYAYLRPNIDSTWHVGLGFDVYFSAAAQIADSPLISNEQFSIGGAKSVRGYFESQKLGDDGVTGTVEIRSPSIAKYIHKKIDDFRFFVFADRGMVRNRNTAAGEQEKWYLGSAGVGMNLTAWDSLRFDLAWAYALEDSDPNTDTIDPAVLEGDTRIHASIEYDF